MNPSIRRAGFQPGRIVACVSLAILASCSKSDDLKSERRKWTQAQTEIMVIGAHLAEFEKDHGRAPDSLEDLVRRPAYAKTWPSAGYHQGKFIDPWGRAYIYEPPDQKKMQFRPKVKSLGRDGKPGGIEADSDIVG